MLTVSLPVFVTVIFTMKSLRTSCLLLTVVQLRPKADGRYTVAVSHLTFGNTPKSSRHSHMLSYHIQLCMRRVLSELSTCLSKVDPRSELCRFAGQFGMKRKCSLLLKYTRQQAIS